jgi:hypothetical protein
MSLADESMLSVRAAYVAVHADTWTVLGPGSLAGTIFQADAQTEPVIALDSDLGSDSREKTKLFVDRPAPALTRGMRLLGKGAQWRIVGDIDDNPANYRVQFEIVKVVPGKDS